MPPPRKPRTPSLAPGGLAAALGYSDQAHLTRNFTQAVGDPPARYADQVDLRRDD